MRPRRWVSVAACTLLVAGVATTEVKNFHPDEDWQEHDHCTAIGVLLPRQTCPRLTCAIKLLLVPLHALFAAVATDTRLSQLMSSRGMQVSQESIMRSVLRRSCPNMVSSPPNSSHAQE